MLGGEARSPSDRDGAFAGGAPPRRARPRSVVVTLGGGGVVVSPDGGGGVLDHCGQAGQGRIDTWRRRLLRRRAGCSIGAGARRRTTHGGRIRQCRGGGARRRTKMTCRVVSDWRSVLASEPLAKRALKPPRGKAIGERFCGVLPRARPSSASGGPSRAVVVSASGVGYRASSGSWAGQITMAGNPTMGSSLRAAMVSSVM